MENNEDLATSAVEDEKTTVIPEEKTVTPEENTVIPEENTDIDSLDLIEELLKEDKPTEPTFFPKKEEKKEEEEGFIDEELLEDIEKGYIDLEKDLEDTKGVLTQKEKELEELNTTTSAYSNALDKLGEHPILGPLNERLLRGEKIDIPEYLTKSLQEDIESLPNMEDIASEKPGVKEVESLQDKLVRRAKNRY